MLGGHMRIAYLDCFSGISGDMFLGALVDAGVPAALLEQTVASLNAAGGLDVRLESKRVDRSGISATKVNVIVNGQLDEPRVEHQHYQDHSHGHTHQHAHQEVLGHTHGAVPTVGAPHAHSHRGLREIREIIARAEITGSARNFALSIFEALGAAEAKIHNIPLEQVHFHEVGAADAIVDIVCAAVGSEALQVDEWICSPLNVGSGMVQCAHGTFPVPAPATAELLSGAPVFSSGIQAELVTPTGAAIVKTLAGSRDFRGHANVLRILVGESGKTTTKSEHEALHSIGIPTETVSVLEATIDDLNPQIFAYVLEQALREGALDAFGVPVQMKKGRSGMLLTVLAKPADAPRLAQLIFHETSTLGLRLREENRFVLPRSYQSVTTPWGEVRVKIGMLNGEVSHVAPEYEDCRRLAEEHSVPLKQVMNEAIRAYQTATKQEAIVESSTKA
jgi:uncharacterized protein (TIGR00299 family) protein